MSELCRVCEKNKGNHARGMCSRCYQSERNKQVKEYPFNCTPFEIENTAWDMRLAQDYLSGRA